MAAAGVWLIPFVDAMWTSIQVVMISWFAREMNDKRGLDSTAQHAIFNFNHTSHTGAEMRRLNDLSVKMMPGPKAIFTGNDFEVEGNVTEHETVNGLKHGDVSFYVPGVDTAVDGTYITIDIDVEATVEAAFDYLVDMLKGTGETGSTLDDLVEGVKIKIIQD